MNREVPPECTSGVGADEENPFVLLYGIPWDMYEALTDALGEYHLRHTYDHGTLEMRRVLYGVTWEDYERFLEALDGHKLRHTYDRGTLEMMSPLSKRHEWGGSLLGRMVERMAEELDIPIQSVGSTTLKRMAAERGIEGDRSYFIANEPRVRGRDDYDPKKDPPPDLAIEVEVTRSCVPRMPVYASMRVPELWRFDGNVVTFYGLTRRGKYTKREQSLAFPFLRPADLLRFLEMRYSTDENSVIRAFVKWVRQQRRKGSA
jgi:Uma2 family endonuclease